MSNQQSVWDNFIEPMEEDKANFDSIQQPKISLSGATWHEPTTTPCSAEYSNYSELFKVLSSVQLETSEIMTMPEVVHGGERESDEGEAIGGKRKHEEVEVGHFDFYSQEAVRVSTLKKSENEKGPKRQRCPETHNMSERRRRDRIRKKMKELQELIPNCYQANRVALLDEAIGYLKALKQQVQVMSMGASVPSPPQYHIPMAQFQTMNIPHFPMVPKTEINSIFQNGINSSPATIPMIPIQPLPLFSTPTFVPFSPPQLHLHSLSSQPHPSPNIQRPFPCSGEGGFFSLKQPDIHNGNISISRQGSTGSSSIRRLSSNCVAKGSSFTDFIMVKDRHIFPEESASSSIH